MAGQEIREYDGEETWWELWDQRRQMAAIQALCYAVYAICLFCAYYQTQYDEPETSSKGKRRKAHAWEREFQSIRQSISSVAEAIKEGNAVVKRARQRVYSEREVYAELVKIGVERPIRYTAYNFLMKDPLRVRALFGCPVEEGRGFLLQMVHNRDDQWCIDITILGLMELLLDASLGSYKVGSV